MTRCLSTWADIKAWVATDPSWGWADTSHTMEPRQRLADTLEQKKSSKFFITRVMHDHKAFVTHATKTFPPDIVMSELKHIADLEATVRQLEGLLDTMKKSHITMQD